MKCQDAAAWTKAWIAWLQNAADLAQNDQWLIEDHLAELASLTTRIKAVEKRIQSETADDPVIARLMTLAGVGLVTAATMRAEIGRFDRFDTGKQLARFCGVTPRNASSGARQADAGLIRAGNPPLRTLLIELAHRLIRTSNPRWGSLAANMLRRGKPKNVVIAAVANRWVRWLYHELKRDPKDPSASGQALQKGAAPSIPAVASTGGGAEADATAKTKGARGRPT